MLETPTEQQLDAINRLFKYEIDHRIAMDTFNLKQQQQKIEYFLNAIP